jgi:hypothetical protein
VALASLALIAWLLSTITQEEALAVGIAVAAGLLLSIVCDRTKAAPHSPPGDSTE